MMSRHFPLRSELNTFPLLFIRGSRDLFKAMKMPGDATSSMVQKVKQLPLPHVVYRMLCLSHILKTSNARCMFLYIELYNRRAFVPY